MPLRFRQSFTLFPGVRLNVGKKSISVSLGAPGATINIGRRGVRATVGLPGTGLSYTSTLLPRAEPGAPRNEAPFPVSQPPGAAPLPVYRPPAPVMQAVASAPLDELSTPGLDQLREVLRAARQQRRDVDRDLMDARAERDSLAAELRRREASIFAWFYRKRIAAIREQQPAVAGEIDRLEQWQELTAVTMDFGGDAEVAAAWDVLSRAFSRLARCERKWDVTADRMVDQRAERSGASRVVDRTPVELGFAASDVVAFKAKALRFQNANGADLLIYPGLILMPRADGAFALLDLRRVTIRINVVSFYESEQTPSDAPVIGHGWYKQNKDGSRDRRFNGNYQIPICRYAQLDFQSGTGLRETWMVSNCDAAFAFGDALAVLLGALDGVEDRRSREAEPVEAPALEKPAPGAAITSPPQPDSSITGQPGFGSYGLPGWP